MNIVQRVVLTPALLLLCGIKIIALSIVAIGWSIKTCGEECLADWRDLWKRDRG